MDRELDKKYRNEEDVLRNEEDALQKDMEELNKRRDHLKKLRDLKDKRDVIKEEMDYIKGKKKRTIIDNTTFGNIILFIVLVLIAGGLVAEGGRTLGKYAVLLLIPIAIILWKLANRFG